MTQDEFDAGSEVCAAMRVLSDCLPNGEFVAEVLLKLDRRIAALERVKEPANG